MNFKAFIAVILLSISFVSFNEVNEVQANTMVVSSDEMVNQVINMIDNLPDECTLKDESAVKNCRAAYDSLLQSQKVEVTNYMDLLEKEGQIAVLYSEINYVIKIIDNLPSVDAFELSDEKKLNEVAAEYNKLDNLQKELVNNYSKLVELTARLNKIYESINEVINLINGLPNVDLIDYTIYEKLEKIELIYDSLSDIQKEKITNINIYSNIKAVLNKIYILIESINNIPSSLTTEYLATLESIQEEYNKLTTSQKTLVTNYESFYKLYISILDAKKFNELINEMINYINLDNKYLLTYLFEKYNEFNDNQKVFITNYQKMVILQEELSMEEEYLLQAQNVIEMINNIPLELTLNDKETIREIRIQYDSLLESSKKYVDNYHLLLEAEAKLLKLENEEYATSIDTLYNEIDNILDDVNNLKDEIEKDEEESKSLIDDIKKFIEETKANEAKGLNKYIIIAIGLTSVFIIVAIIYIFSLHHSKINIDKEEY